MNSSRSRHGVPVCVLLRSTSERRRIPRSPRMCSVSSLLGGGGASILAAVRERPRPAPMELAEWLADRVRYARESRRRSRRCSPAPSREATAAARAPRGRRRRSRRSAAWPGSAWQEVARLADLAANREAMGRLLVRRNPAARQALRAMRELLGVTEDEFRERGRMGVGAGGGGAAVARADRGVASLGTVRLASPADAPGFRRRSAPSGRSPTPLPDMPQHRVAGRSNRWVGAFHHGKAGKSGTRAASSPSLRPGNHVSRARYTVAAALLAAAVASQPSSVLAQNGLPPAGWAAFTRLLDTYADSDRVVGTSALVMRDGKVLARHGYGFADKRGGKRVDDRSIFHWGSVTKTLTAISIMQLRDRGCSRSMTRSRGGCRSCARSTIRMA